MSVLCDREIKWLAQNRELITPFVENSVSQVDGNSIISYGLSSAGYDLRCADEWKIFKPSYHTGVQYIDPKNIDESNFDFVTGKGYCIIPGNTYALTRTLERIKMPRNVVARVLGKSTYARVGLIVNVTPIEPEWEGYITIEVSNSCPIPVMVYSGEGICQIMFEWIQHPDVSYADRKGKYQNQPAEIVHAKVLKNNV